MQPNRLHIFINKKINQVLLGFALALLIVSYVAFFHTNPIEIFPSNENYEIQFYTDANDGGHSEIINSQITDSSLNVRFILKPGFVRPYVGIVDQASRWPTLQSKPLQFGENYHLWKKPEQHEHANCFRRCEG